VDGGKEGGPDGGRGLEAALDGTRALLLDMDGVLVSRGEPIPGAGAAIARLSSARVPFRVITNTSLWSRAAIARRLSEAGIRIAPERIVTALSATVHQLARQMPGASVYLLGSADAIGEFASSDLRLLSSTAIDEGGQADAVVIGDSEDQLTYANLDRAFRQIRVGAAFVAMHRNPWWLTAAGPTLDSGALVVGLEYATGRRATVAGKPSPTVFRAAFRELADELAGTGTRLRRAEVAMVGDDLRTDLAPARRLGMRTVLVLTGKHGAADLARARQKPRTPLPDAIAPSIAELVDELEAVSGQVVGSMEGPAS
jgi:HAD superfamily hydrolase (TIGR01450 family)